MGCRPCLVLFICGQKSNLAGMDKKREMLLSELESLLDGGELCPEGPLSLSDVCRRRLGVCPPDLDEILLEELGLEGEEIFAAYGCKVIDNRNKFY